MRVLDVAEIDIVSINEKFQSTGRGRLFLSPAYRAFKQELTLRCKKTKIDPPYQVTIKIKTATDIDNSIKVILDSLQAKGVITNDKFVKRLIVEKGEKNRGEKGSIIVEVETI